MNFSGCPALFLPRSALTAWHGILVRDENDKAEPDFVQDSGGRWFVHDRFDFANPVTHYDHLCAAFVTGEEVRLIRVGDCDALAISTGDDVFGWWAEKHA